MTPLLDSLAAQFGALAPAQRDAQGLAAARAEAMQALQRTGLPGPRAERWKYTPLRALARRSFVAATQVELSAELQQQVTAIAAPRLVFVNGSLHAALTDLAGLDEGVDVQPLSVLLEGSDPRVVSFLARRYAGEDAPFAEANAALAVEGAVVRVAASVIATRPLNLVYVGVRTEADSAWHLRSLIELRERAKLQVVEHWLSDDAPRQLATAVCHVHLKSHARLQQLRIQQGAAGAQLFARTDAVLAADADYRRLDLELGLGLSRHELNIALQGRGAQAQADGVLLANGKAHVDTRLGIDHAVGGSSTRLTWRGLARDSGKLAFHGGILIREGADGSDAQLSNKNLLLSAAGEINTQPVLVIHADEVKAAHGATVGRLDPTALFYLRSRGLPPDAAQQLLTAAFCNELLSGLEPALLEPAGLALAAALARGAEA